MELQSCVVIDDFVSVAVLGKGHGVSSGKLIWHVDAFGRLVLIVYLICGGDTSEIKIFNHVSFPASPAYSKCNCKCMDIDAGH